MTAAVIIIKIIFFTGGIIAFLAGILNWKWFLHSKNAELLLKTFGYKILRIIYAILGIILISLSYSIR